MNRYILTRSTLRARRKTDNENTLRSPWTPFLILLFVLCITPAYAEDTVSTYQPAFCEFAATFPEEPYKTRRCDDEEEKQCYDQLSFTHVFELSSTVNFRVICNPIGEEVKKNYSGDVMQATLRAMTDRSVVKTFETSFREEEQYKQAGLVGEGKVGRTPTIYIAQLWIGEKSALSVEAELIGEASEDADQMFSEILKSVGYKEKAPKKKEEATEESPSETQTAP